MKLVLLPGLDGTGELFAPLIEALPKSIEVQIIRYNTQKKESYQELIEQVSSHLPTDDFILLAESFSGFIAYEIALKKPKNLKHLIVVATFLQNPRELLLKFVPSYIFSLPTPKSIIKIFFLGLKSDDKVVDLFQNTIEKVSPKVIYFRLQEIKKLTPKSEKIMIPTAYIQADSDQLVLKSSLKDWENVCPKLDVYKIEGKHFILQSNPKKCGEIIAQIFRGHL